MSKFKVGDNIRQIDNPKVEGIIDLVDGTFGYQVLWVIAQARTFHSQQWVNRYYELVPTEKAPAHKFNVGDTIRNSHLKTAIGNTGRITEQTNEGYMVLWSDCVEPWSQSFTYIEGEYELVEEDWAMNPKAPAHYVEGRTIEPRSVVKDWELNFNLGNVLKYISRVGRKGEDIEDLRKAITYLEFEIEDRGNNG